MIRTTAGFQKTSRKKCSCPILAKLAPDFQALGCLKRAEYVTVVFKQVSESVPGEYLGRLVLGMQDDDVKIYGCTIF